MVLLSLLVEGQFVEAQSPKGMVRAGLKMVSGYASSTVALNHPQTTQRGHSTWPQNGTPNHGHRPSTVGGEGASFTGHGCRGPGLPLLLQQLGHYRLYRLRSLQHKGRYRQWGKTRKRDKSFSCKGRGWNIKANTRPQNRKSFRMYRLTWRLGVVEINKYVGRRSSRYLVTWY